MKARGKAETGQKTMLDVLVPVQQALASGAAPVAVAARANEAAEATIPVKATRGRASFLGDRSIGHMDPGARSSALIVEAVASCFRIEMSNVGLVIVRIRRWWRRARPTWS